MQRCCGVSQVLSYDSAAEWTPATPKVNPLVVLKLEYSRITGSLYHQVISSHGIDSERWTCDCSHQEGFDCGMLNLCPWSRYMMQYGIAGPQWVNWLWHWDIIYHIKLLQATGFCSIGTSHHIKLWGPQTCFTKVLWAHDWILWGVPLL